jgi:hypothetical protein
MMESPERGEGAPSSTTLELVNMANRGIQLCQEGMWTKGLGYLKAVAEAKSSGLELPGRFYSFLGFGLAAFESRYTDGLALCRRAVEIEFYRPENYVNLARTCLLLDARRSAVRAIEQGLRIDPSSQELHDLRREVGWRKQPVLPFLSRGNPVNQLLGRVRYGFLRL